MSFLMISLQAAGRLHDLRGDVQDRQGRAEDAEGEEGDSLSEEHGRVGRAGGQACQGACADAQTSNPGYQSRELGNSLEEIRGNVLRN